MKRSRATIEFTTGAKEGLTNTKFSQEEIIEMVQKKFIDDKIRNASVCNLRQSGDNRIVYKFVYDRKVFDKKSEMYDTQRKTIKIVTDEMEHFMDDPNLSRLDAMASAGKKIGYFNKVKVAAIASAVIVGVSALGTCFIKGANKEYDTQTSQASSYATEMENERRENNAIPNGFDSWEEYYNNQEEMDKSR